MLQPKRIDESNLRPAAVLSQQKDLTGKPDVQNCWQKLQKSLKLLSKWQK